MNPRSYLFVPAAAQAGGAAVAVDGKMVDRPVLARAQALLEAARSFGLPSNRAA